MALDQPTRPIATGRRAGPVAALVLLPAVGYLAVVLLPWLLGHGLVQESYRAWDLVVTAFTPLGALVGLAVSGVELLSAGRRSRLPWVGVLVASLVVLAWFLSPAGTALTYAQFD